MNGIVFKRQIHELGRSLATTIPQEIIELFKVTKTHVACFSVDDNKVILKFEVKKKK